MLQSSPTWSRRTKKRTERARDNTNSTMSKKTVPGVDAPGTCNSAIPQPFREERMLHPFLPHLANPGNAPLCAVPDDCPPPNWGGRDREWERAEHIDIPSLPTYRLEVEMAA